MTCLPLLFYQNETRLSKRLHQDYTLLYIESYKNRGNKPKYLNHAKMKEGILNTIFIHMSRNEIGYLLEIISRIAHRNTGACLPDNGNIIAAIAESHGFIYVQTR